jgi:hypothetical protein
MDGFISTRYFLIVPSLVFIVILKSTKYLDILPVNGLLYGMITVSEPQEITLGL